MTNKRTVLMCAGDIGGARSLFPIVDEFVRNKVHLIIINHGFLGDAIAKSKHKTLLVDRDQKIIKKLFADKIVIAYLFATSVKDTEALSWARFAQDAKVQTFCLLDSAIRIAHRMKLDDKPMFEPDIMFLQDDLAYKCAVQDGFNHVNLVISGQPALSNLLNEYHNWGNKNKQRLKEKNRWIGGKKLIAFVSEPVKHDQGGSEKSKSYRGYTEEQVIILLCRYLQNYHEKITIGIMPHPRENKTQLLDYFDQQSGKLQCKIINCDNSRNVILASDGVVGMASILLYEAWLIGKPVMSLQPNIINNDYLYLENKLRFFIKKEEELSAQNKLWIKQVLNSQSDTVRKKELDLHQQSIKSISSVITGYQQSEI
jgi:hypothetical protein